MKSSYLDTIAKSGLFRYLEEKDYEKAWDELNISAHSYVDGQIIYSQGDLVNHIAIIHSGSVRAEKFHIDGESSFAYLYSEGEAFAFEGAVSGKKTSPMDFIAAGDTTVLYLDVELVFIGVYKDQLIRGFMELLSNDNIKKLYRIEALTQKTLRGKILSYFQILVDKHGSNTFRLDMSREELAHYLCANRTALSHELNEMKREGIIEVSGKNIKILLNVVQTT